MPPLPPSPLAHACDSIYFFNVCLGVLSDVADLDGLKEGVQINVHGKLLKTAEQQNNQSRIVAQNIERLHLDFFLKLKDHKGQ